MRELVYDTAPLVIGCVGGAMSNPTRLFTARCLYYDLKGKGGDG